MNEVIQEGVAVDPVVVPVSTPVKAEPAKEAAPQADENVPTQG